MIRRLSAQFLLGFHEGWSMFGSPFNALVRETKTALGNADQSTITLIASGVGDGFTSTADVVRYTGIRGTGT